MNFADIIYLIGIGQGLLLSFSLFIRKGIPGKIFSVIVLLFSYEIFSTYIYFQSDYKSGWAFFFIKEAVGFLYGPLLYLYTSFQTGRINRFNKRQILHLLPFILYVIIDINTVTPLFIETSSLIGHIDERGVGLYRIVMYFCRAVSIIAYLIPSLLIILRYKNKLNDRFSNISKISLTWLKILILASFFFWLAGLAAVIVFVYFPEHVIIATPFFSFSIAVSFYIAAYFALHQSASISDPTSGKESSVKYSNNVIPHEVLKKHSERIINSLERDYLYLEEELTLDDLSKKTGLPSHTISQAMSAVLNTNFNKLINSYRINHAIELISSNNDISIISVCYKSGFNSKSVFNTTFKQITGKTPTQFKKEIAGKNAAKH